MTGIYIEAGMTCPSCESFIPLNALTATVRCPACGDGHEMGAEGWASLLEDAVKETYSFEENEGRSSTMFGLFNWKLQYGRQMPRYSGTTESIPPDSILDGLAEGRVLHPVTGEATVVRPLPDFCTEALGGVIALVGEDPAMVPGGEDQMAVPGEGVTGPVAFQCPGCGASLIVDAGNRVSSCRFCDTSVTMPDELWQRLHPAKMKRCWYMLFDILRRPFSWEEDLLGACGDSSGDLFLAVESETGDMPVIARVCPNRIPVWIRTDVDANPRLEDPGPGLLTGPGGTLLVPSSNGRDILVLSTLDGSLERVIEGGEDQSPRIPARMTMEGCCDLTVLPDGSLFVFADRDSSDVSGFYREFLRYDMEGRLMPTWPEPAPAPVAKKPGFLSRIAALLQKAGKSAPGTPYLKSIGSRPLKIRDPDVLLASGQEGAIYMFSSPWLAIFEPTGELRRLVELPGSRFNCRPCVREDGSALILAEGPGGIMDVMAVPADDSTIALLGMAQDADSLEDAQVLLQAGDGGVHALGYGGFWTVLPISGIAASGVQHDVPERGGIDDHVDLRTGD